jgi:CheY-like chemotaxis protein
VAVESQVGQGSRFKVSIPWRSIAVFQGKTDLFREETSASITVSTAAGLPRPRILLAEDNRANLTLVQGLLQAHGYEVIVAQNGFEAVERARAEQPALILMDIQMPGLDGLEAIRRIRADGEKAVAGVPIIALTALAMGSDKERCLKAGANAYLSKPASMRQLLELIQALLKH